MDRRIIPLIMCGGAGTRLWPASREVHPKQFLPLFGPRSTFQDTLKRVSDPALFERPIVITNMAYRFMVLEQLAEIGIEADILLEPARRDSGPAIAAGAAFAQVRDGDAVVLALAADHVVRDTAAFVAACRQGQVAAEAGHLERLAHQFVLQVRDLVDDRKRLAVVPVAVHREEHARLDLPEAIEHTLHAEIRRARRPDRALARRPQHRDDRLGHVR